MDNTDSTIKILTEDNISILTRTATTEIKGLMSEEDKKELNTVSALTKEHNQAIKDMKIISFAVTDKTLEIIEGGI